MNNDEFSSHVIWGVRLGIRDTGRRAEWTPAPLQGKETVEESRLKWLPDPSPRSFSAMPNCVENKGLIQNVLKQNNIIPSSLAKSLDSPNKLEDCMNVQMN